MYKTIPNHLRDINAALTAADDAEASRLLTDLCADIVQTHNKAEGGGLAAYFLDEGVFTSYIAAERDDAEQRASERHAERVHEAMLLVAKLEPAVVYGTTGGNMMALCFERAGYGEILIGEASADEEGFGWCVPSESGEGGRNFGLTTDTSDWSVEQWVVMFQQVVRNPTRLDYDLAPLQAGCRWLAADVTKY